MPLHTPHPPPSPPSLCWRRYVTTVEIEAETQDQLVGTTVEQALTIARGGAVDNNDYVELRLRPHGTSTSKKQVRRGGRGGESSRRLDPSLGSVPPLRKTRR